jgi:hypothetical protein
MLLCACSVYLSYLDVTGMNNRKTMYCKYNRYNIFCDNMIVFRKALDICLCSRMPRIWSKGTTNAEGNMG